MALVVALILGAIFIFICFATGFYLLSIFGKDEPWEQRLDKAISFERENFKEETLYSKKTASIESFETLLKIKHPYLLPFSEYFPLFLAFIILYLWLENTELVMSFLQIPDGHAVEMVYVWIGSGGISILSWLVFRLMVSLILQKIVKKFFKLGDIEKTLFDDKEFVARLNEVEIEMAKVTTKKNDK